MSDLPAAEVAPVIAICIVALMDQGIITDIAIGIAIFRLTAVQHKQVADIAAEVTVGIFAPMGHQIIALITEAVSVCIGAVMLQSLTADVAVGIVFGLTGMLDPFAAEITPVVSILIHAIVGHQRLANVAV